MAFPSVESFIGPGSKSTNGPQKLKPKLGMNANGHTLTSGKAEIASQKIWTLDSKIKYATSYSLETIRDEIVAV